MEEEQIYARHVIEHGVDGKYRNGKFWFNMNPVRSLARDKVASPKDHRRGYFVRDE